MLGHALQLAVRHPIAPLAAEPVQQPAAVQNCLALAVEALPRPRPNGLHSVNAVLQAERGTVTGAIDGRLDRAPGSTAIASSGQDELSTPAKAGAAAIDKPPNRQRANCRPSHHRTLRPTPSSRCSPHSVRVLSAIDHHRSDAEAEQAPEPDALHGPSSATSNVAFMRIAIA